MRYRIDYIANWQIYEQHYCDNHKVVEYSEAWATKGLVSVMTLEATHE